MTDTKEAHNYTPSVATTTTTAPQPAPVLMQVASKNEVLLAGHPVFTGTEQELENELLLMRARDEVCLVTTPNVDQTLDLQGGGSFFEAYQIATLRLFDGMPLVLLAKMLGAGGAERHTGADLLPKVAGMSAKYDWTVVIAGGSDEASTTAAANLRSANPGARVVSLPFPRLTNAADEQSLQVLQALADLKPDVVFLCLGSPKQEEWFLYWQSSLPAGIYVGAGAAVDFAAGEVVRAPVWAQKACLEWAWRLAQEPARLGHRYLVKGPRFAGILARSLVARPRRAAPITKGVTT